MADPNEADELIGDFLGSEMLPEFVASRKRIPGTFTPIYRARDADTPIVHSIQVTIQFVRTWEC